MTLHNAFIATLIGATLLSSVVNADEVPKKTVAIVYEEGKTPQSLFHRSLPYLHMLVNTGDLRMAELGNAKIFGEVIDIQTATDDGVQSRKERDHVISRLDQMLGSDNLPYSTRMKHMASNLFFGDKSLGYILNPYNGCYNHDFLAKGFEKSGYEIVDASENPDVKITVGIDVCMPENEFKAYISKNSSLQAKQTSNASSKISTAFGTDLMTTGAQMQLTTSNYGGNAGLAVAGVGLALNTIAWLASESPKEKDVIRYHVKFEGNNKQSLDFYPLIITKEAHDAGQPIKINSYTEAEQLVFTSFLAWNASDKIFGDKLPAVLYEKDIVKVTELMINSNKTKKQ